MTAGPRRLSYDEAAPDDLLDHLHPEEPEVIDDTEARERDLGAFRGAMLALALCAFVWGILAGIILVGLLVAGL